MTQGYQILWSFPNVFLFGIYSELFYKLCNLIIANCRNIRIIETKFGAPGNRTPLQIKDRQMQTLIILILVIVVAWILFRPFSKNELERHKDKDWPDMNL